MKLQKPLETHYTRQHSILLDSLEVSPNTTVTRKIFTLPTIFQSLLTCIKSFDKKITLQKPKMLHVVVKPLLRMRRSNISIIYITKYADCCIFYDFPFLQIGKI